MSLRSVLRRHRSKYFKYQILTKNRYLCSFLPKTIQYSALKYQDLLREYGTLYCKPDSGSFGKGIYKLEYVDGDTGVLTDFNGKVTTLNLKRNFLTRNYILQQGIDLVEIDDCLVDFRIITTKTKKSWDFSGIVSRLGMKNRIITNYTSGGSACNVLDILPQVTSISPRQIIKDIKAICIEASKQIDTDFGGQMRKLGVDIALDKDGKLWIIEVNTTPKTEMFKVVGSKSMRKRVSVPNFNNR